MDLYNAEKQCCGNIFVHIAQLYWNALSNIVISAWLLGDSNESHKFSWFVSGRIDRVHKCLQPTLVDIFDIVWCHQESMYDAVKTNFFPAVYTRIIIPLLLCYYYSFWQLSSKQKRTPCLYWSKNIKILMLVSIIFWTWNIKDRVPIFVNYHIHCNRIIICISSWNLHYQTLVSVG